MEALKFLDWLDMAHEAFESKKKSDIIRAKNEYIYLLEKQNKELVTALKRKNIPYIK